MSINIHRYKRVSVFASLTFIVASAGCNNTKDTLNSNDFTKTLREQGWIILPIPDSTFDPGTVIRVVDENGNIRVDWIGNISSCNVPAEVLKTVDGNAPSFESTEDYDFSLKALLNIKGVEVGPDFNRVAKAKIKINGTEAKKIDLLHFTAWITNPNNNEMIPKSCNEWLEMNDTYLINNAMMVSKGEITFYGQTGAKINLPSLELKKNIVDLSSDASLTWASDSKLTFTEPVYLAVKRVQRLQGSWKMLGTPSDKSKDVTPLLIEYADRQSLN